MDDLTLIRSFQAERAGDDPGARAAARQALEARFGPASPTAPAKSARRRRRGLVALAGAAVLSLAVACLLILSSGPNAEPAAAEALRITAGVAADSPPDPLPGPGQFLYTRTISLELQGWLRGRPSSFGGPLNQPGAFTALLPTKREFWISPEGRGRSRETTGRPRFFSTAERSRWRQAGSPLPAPFDPSTDLSKNVHILEARRGVIDIELPRQQGFGPNFGFPGLAGLPTEPEALRRAVRDREVAGIGNNPGGRPVESLGPLDTEETLGGLWGILGQPNASPALRAAAFGAMAELPGIELDRDATDLVGRRGYSITYTDKYKLRSEFIFDPETATVLGQRTAVLEPRQTPAWEQIPPVTVIRDTAYLQSGVVDSIRERGDKADGEPVATTGSLDRR